MALEIEAKVESETLGTNVQPVWIKPEIATFLPIAASQGAGNQPGEGLNNVS